MPRITPIHSKTLECIALKLGFKFERQESSHRIFSKPNLLRPFPIPNYKELDVFIIKSFIRAAKITNEKYFELLKECK